MRKMDKNCILVTGGAGFIGSHFVDYSLSLGKRVVVLDALTYAGHMENLEQAARSPLYEFVKGDIRDLELVSGLLKKNLPSAVFNFAAETHVDRSIDGPAEFIGTNITGTFSLLRASLAYRDGLDASGRESFRYVQVSTDEVFGSLGSTGKFSELSPIEPNSPYSASKASADHLVRAWFHTYGLPVVVTHCSNNYGPRQYPEKLIPYMITRALSGMSLPVYGSGMNVRDWIHVEDHCRGIWLAAGRGRPGERYCFGGNEEWHNIDLVKLMCSELDRLRPRQDGRRYEQVIEFVKDRLGHDLRYAIDDARAVRELGYEHKHGFKDALPATVRWYVENQQWCSKVMKKSAKG